jgi:E3 ubiquitin-protein ligase DOA10
MLPINLLVTFLVIALGFIALFSGIRKKFPKYLRFLGYTRFANYFMITIYPIQSHYLPWTWERLLAIALFAVPIWLALHFGLMPIRNR